MKGNRKLLKEVLKEIRHDMTNEEVLNLLADSKISENTSRASEKYTMASVRPMPLPNLPAAGHLFLLLPEFSRKQTINQLMP